MKLKTNSKADDCRLNVGIARKLRRDIKAAAAKADVTVKVWVTDALVTQLANPSNNRADRPFGTTAN